MIAASVSHRSARIVERNVMAYKAQWVVFLTALAEPFLYLFSIGIGVGELVGDLEVAGRVVTYEEFVAPGLMAAAAMNGSILDTTYNFFVKYKYLRTYDAILATPLTPADVSAGEVLWSLLRGAVYAAVFLLTMVALGLVHSTWAILAVPVALLVGFAFAGAGLAATTYMKSFVDFDYVTLALIPMFLFSATFFPLDRYPEVVSWAVQATPLYQGVALERALVLGDVTAGLWWHAAYLAVVGWFGVRLAGRRIRALLQP